MSHEIIYRKVLALVVALGGYIRIPKSELQSAKSRFLKGGFPDNNALCELITLGKKIGEASKSREMASISSDDPIGKIIIDEYKSDNGDYVDINLLVLTALYCRYPTTDFSDVLKTAKSQLEGVRGTMTWGVAVEIICCRLGEDPPKNNNQRIHEFWNAPTIAILRKCLSEYETDDPSDLATKCNAGFRGALALGEDDPECINLALMLGDQYMNNLSRIVDANRADWGLGNMDFPQRFSKLLEKMDMIDKAISCIQAAVDHGLSMKTKSGYIGRLEKLRKKYGRLSER